METLSLKTVLDAERQAQAHGGGAYAADLRRAAQKWLVEAQLRTLLLEDGVREVIDRIIAPRPAG